MQFQCFALAALAVGAIASPALAPRYTNGCACAIVSSSASAVLAASPKVTPTVDAQLAHDCLASVPLHATEAKALVEAILPYVEFQTTTSYLKNPPSGYLEPATDLAAGFAAVIANISSGAYKTEYEFQASLWKVINSAHDGHFRFLPDLLSKAIAFRRPLSLVSVSLDGISSPKVYSYQDILLSQNSAFVPSALETIEGETASKYIEDFSQLGALNDPDALYNSMFFSPGFAAESAGWQGYFAGSGRFGWIYPGANTTVCFENGTEIVVENKAAIIGNFQGVTDGPSFYQKFCTGPAPTSNGTASPATPAAATVPPTGYPEPIFITADQQVSGYYLPNSDVAVLAMISFEPTIPVQWQQVVDKFLAAAKADGKTKLVVDLAANGGGLIFQGYDVFRQLFPQIVQEGNTRFRDSAEFMAAAQVISSAFPPGFDPHTSGSDTLINLWESPFNYKFDYTSKNELFSSFDEKFAPHEFNGDNFTNLIRWDFNDDILTINETYGVGEYITGYGPRQNFTQPFAAEDIIMIYDGYCASTCTIFSEFMRTQGGVKSIAYGGRPSDDAATPIIQAVGGVRGTNNWAYTYLNYLAGSALEVGNVTAAQKALLTPLTNTLPVSRSTDTSLNVRDNILTPNIGDGTPTQFLYEPADCRLFYTPAMMANVTAIWESAAAAAWGGLKCNAGSLPSSNSTLRRGIHRDVKRAMEVVGSASTPAPDRSEGWLAKYVMTFPK
ncbi:Peptidase S41 family protein [Lachnellula suecica]|uniref:Peptidase S41 family protein n=1 Tax=Lachnellula suecica TaxID=602035 RepID=A0A8T9C6G9_9HELO|nr:Peptidase S41 family protein [Lachnellula suecica]